ncbi:MAG: nucleotidyltransferase family protein [Candidatus Omnitrophica bacterium]|nr:nucleotidyltransferase family protein [Candidatus Omnitrophota bacterium]MCM8801985.1 nucleotidyltransferase family protein [Candidatus Omnitrophota bacterium]
MKDFTEIKRIISSHLNEIKERFGIKEFGIFGSYVRGEESQASDLDILVEFEEGKKTFDNYMELKFYLEDLLNLKVDLVIKSAIKPRLRPYILEEVVYV